MRAYGKVSHIYWKWRFGIGDLKGVIAEKIGLEPDVQRLFFRGIEKDDQIHLEMAGLKNNSKLLLKENIAKVEEVSTSNDKTEEVKETQVSKGSELVAEVKADVDKLAEQAHMNLFFINVIFNS